MGDALSGLEPFPFPFPDPFPEPLPPVCGGRHEYFPSLPFVQTSAVPELLRPDESFELSHKTPSVTPPEFDWLYAAFPEDFFTPFDQTNFFPDILQV